MSGMPQPNDLPGVSEGQHLAGRHHAALDALRPYFVATELNPAAAPAFVRHSLDVSRILREMALAETAANLWAAILPGLAGGKSIDRARWILLGAEACEASHEAGRTVSRLADIVEQDALDTPAGPAQRFLRAAAALAQAAIDGWRHDRGALEIRTRALALCQADAPLAPLGFRALLMLIDEAVIQNRLKLARRALDAASDRVSGAIGKVAFLESEWIRRSATVLALEGRLDEAVAEFRRGIALHERPVALPLAIAYSGSGSPAIWRMYDDGLDILLRAGFTRREAVA